VASSIRCGIKLGCQCCSTPSSHGCPVVSPRNIELLVQSAKCPLSGSRCASHEWPILDLVGRPFDHLKRLVLGWTFWYAKLQNSFLVGPRDMVYNLTWVETRIQSNTKRFESCSNPLPGSTSVQQMLSVDGKPCVDVHLNKLLKVIARCFTVFGYLTSYRETGENGWTPRHYSRS